MTPTTLSKAVVQYAMHVVATHSNNLCYDTVLCVERKNGNAEKASHIGSIVGAFLGSMLCLLIIFAIIVLLYKYR